MMITEQPVTFDAWIKRYVGEQDATKMRFSVEELQTAFDAGVSTPKPADASAVVEERMLPDDAVERAREVLERLDGHGFQNQAEFEAALFTGKQFVAAMLAFFTPKPANPIPMILHCPTCHTQHIDEPDEHTPEWDNPPHRSHLCHACGCIWRPADVPTEGVAQIATRGKADTPKPADPTSVAGERMREAAEAICRGATDDCTAGRRVFVDPDDFDRLNRILDEDETHG